MAREWRDLMESQERDVVSPGSAACGAAAGGLVGSSDLADKRRTVVTALLALGVPFQWHCVFAHICMAGHMAHPPYSMWDHAADVFWQGCYVAGGVFVWRSRFKYRLSIFLCLLLSVVLTD